MKSTLLALISLFISCFILFFANGLINVLLPVRMGLDLVDTQTIGLVLSLYFLGMLLGAIFSKDLIKKAGHVRMFAGCVSLSSVSILICSLYTDPILWGAMRIVLGFCNACAFTAMESWISDSATKENRGKLLSVYHGTALLGLFSGQFLMNVADPGESVLFVLSGIFLCMAVVPVALSRHKGPVVEDVTVMSIQRLSLISPLGVVSCFIYGLVYSSMYNLLPVFAKTYDIEGFELSLYVGFSILGAFAMQFPIGYLSDKYDRRTVLLTMISFSIMICITVPSFANGGLSWPLILSTLLTGGTLACIYPLGVSETLDKLKQSEMVTAMSTMILISSIGGVLGPYSASLLMTTFGTASLFYYIAAIEILLAAFVIYRMNASKALPVNEQENYVMQSVLTQTSSELDPRTQYHANDSMLSNQAQAAQELAQFSPAAAVKMAQAVAVNDPGQGIEVASAVANVEGVKVLRLLEIIEQVAPSIMLQITQEISKSQPELRVEMATAAASHAPNSVLEIARYYAATLDHEMQHARPADRRDTKTLLDAQLITNSLCAIAPAKSKEITKILSIPNLPL